MLDDGFSIPRRPGRPSILSRSYSARELAQGDPQDCVPCVRCGKARAVQLGGVLTCLRCGYPVLAR
jgi:hypothetical protein